MGQRYVPVTAWPSQVFRHNIVLPYMGYGHRTLGEAARTNCCLANGRSHIITCFVLLVICTPASHTQPREATECTAAFEWTSALL